MILKRLLIVSSILTLLLLSGCGGDDIQIVNSNKINLTGIFFQSKLVCFENSCSAQSLNDERIAACYKGCRIPSVGEIDTCEETCSLIYD